MGFYVSLCVVLVATLATFSNGQTKNYCALSSCRENIQKHTMCTFKSEQPASTCGKILRVGLTKKEQDELVDTHNDYRAKVASGRELRGNPGPQPPASNMRFLKWDNELATIAQRWVNQCRFEHDKCRNIDRYQVGQNIAIQRTTGSTEFSIPSYVKLWYDEVAKVNRSEVPAFTNFRGVGHYTQLVWALTTRIGCAFIRYQETGSIWISGLLICNYGEAGNWKGEALYKIAY